jgi:hypothetical protein
MAFEVGLQDLGLVFRDTSEVRCHGVYWLVCSMDRRVGRVALRSRCCVRAIAGKKRAIIRPEAGRVYSLDAVGTKGLLGTEIFDEKIPDPYWLDVCNG